MSWCAATGAGAGGRYRRSSMVCGEGGGGRRGEHLSAHPSSPDTPERKVRVRVSFFFPARSLWGGAWRPGRAQAGATCARASWRGGGGRGGESTSSLTPHHQMHLREEIRYGLASSFQRASFGPGDAPYFLRVVWGRVSEGQVSAGRWRAGWRTGVELSGAPAPVAAHQLTSCALKRRCSSLP